MARKKRATIKELYYITHSNNLASIVEKGILSHHSVVQANLKPEKIYDDDIVNKRRAKQAPDGNSLWHFANVYFQARNPMLYRVLHQYKIWQDIVVVAVKTTVLDIAGAFIADGNAASTDTAIYPVDEGKEVLSDTWDIVSSEWWNGVDGSKRKIMAECLVPDKIAPEYISTVYVSSHETAQRLSKQAWRNDIAIIPEPKMFFMPSARYRVASNLVLAEGDLFFSSMQTLTVSVNTVGVMGKGLASRAKYQFPDVYVAYQDACRNKKLHMGKPFLYKREASLEEELSADVGSEASAYSTGKVPNSVKRFLLFPTKRHWRENSDIDGIEQGLLWLSNNYQREGITSLAIPALGCGLGNLSWEDVGPLMCRYLAALEIQVVIYLPREKAIDKHYLTREYLLRQ